MPVGGSQVSTCPRWRLSNSLSGYRLDDLLECLRLAPFPGRCPYIGGQSCDQIG